MEVPGVCGSGDIWRLCQLYSQWNQIPVLNVQQTDWIAQMSPLLCFLFSLFSWACLFLVVLVQVILRLCFVALCFRLFVRAEVAQFWVCYHVHPARLKEQKPMLPEINKKV